jgi:ABC-2 type transport system ATP-binding protein
MSVEISGLSCRGRNEHGLSNISLSVARGNACLLLGPNGAGKSLLLATLVGLVRPTAGRVVVNGLDLVRQTTAVRRTTGYLPQLPSAFVGLTVYEQLDFLARCHGLAGREREESVTTMLEVVGLLEVSRMEAALLTPGQQRRLALAGALVHHPAVLLLDTPLAGLDVAGREELLEVLHEVRTLGATCLIASDRPAEVFGLCTQAAVLDAGLLRWYGPIAELPAEYGGTATPAPSSAGEVLGGVS